MVGQPQYYQDIENRTPLFICLLGKFRLLSKGQPLLVPSNGKIEALLRALVLHHEQCSPRDTLLSLLWPNQDSALAGQSLDSLVYSFRKQLKSKLGGASPIIQGEGCYSLNYSAGIDADVLCFERFVRAGNAHWRNGDITAAVSSYEAALRLYRGELYGGSDLSATIERERLHVLHLTVLARLADYHFARGEYDAARDYGQRLLASDPCREDAHRLLMRCYMRLGHRAEALRQYQLCAQILQSEFDAAPEAATTALFEQVRLSPETV